MRMKLGWGKWEIPEETCKPETSSGTFPKCKNLGATPPGIESGLPRWEANDQTTKPPWPHDHLGMIPFREQDITSAQRDEEYTFHIHKTGVRNTKEQQQPPQPQHRCHQASDHSQLVYSTSFPRQNFGISSTEETVTKDLIKPRMPAPATTDLTTVPI
ncbi:hypothetical protein PR048_011437 [Dryococelus australis]|uniref:Prolactin receptor n=1 Tax=Dryococelus australis TaxID=614101 RepID=A0ABQ9HLJ7_9NEOP|nr:hypothetical protein PR048_011437 [Dryococelus australis]